MEKQIEKQFSEIHNWIIRGRENAFRAVNKELIELYWRIGRHISTEIEKQKWGKGVVQNLADFIQANEPDLKGFSARNLWRMKQFYDTYYRQQELMPILIQLPWSSHLHLLSKTKTILEKEFYLRLSVKEKYSVRELGRQISSGLFERIMISGQKLPPALTQLHPNLSKIFRDTYTFDFLKLNEDHSEKEFQKAILSNLKNFILEIGRDFILMGQEYRIQVGKHDFFIDLVFYHRELKCLVAFELKIDEFKPEYLGKMNFYLEALDRDVRKEHENPSIGIILCKGRDESVIEYALNRSISPTMISDYETKLIPKLKLQSKLQELFLKNFDSTG